MQAKKGDLNPAKMRSVITDLEEESVNVPKAWRGMLFSERIRDHVRFNQADEMLVMFKDEAACITDDDEFRVHAIDTAAEAIKGLARKLPACIKDGQDPALLCLVKLAGGLAIVKELNSETTTDLAILGDMLGFGSKGRQEQTKALAKVLDLKEDMSNYHGVLKSLFVEHSFAALVAWIEGGVDEQDSTLLAKELEDSFHDLGNEDLPKHARPRFDELLKRAVCAMAGGQAGHVKGSVKQILAALTECMSGVPNKLEMVVQEACASCDLPWAEAESKLDVAAATIDMLFLQAVFDVSGLLSGMSPEACAMLKGTAPIADSLGVLEKSHAYIMAKRALVDATVAIGRAVGTQRASKEIASLLQVGDAKFDKAGTLNEGTTSAWMKMKESVRALASTEMAKEAADVLQHFKDLAKEVARKSVDTKG